MSHILGYALASNFVATPLFESTQRLVHELCKGGTAPLQADRQVALNSQLCLAASRRGQGLLTSLLAQLNYQLAPHYDWPYATIHRRNLRSLRFHGRQGYQYVTEDAERISFIKQVEPAIAMPSFSAGVIVRSGLLTASHICVS
jgi:hypothetical protein